MHCGPQKGRVLEQFLLEHVQLHPRPLDGTTYHIVEFGTYCGYSLIRMANALLSEGIRHFHIHTIDIVEPTVARRMVQHVVQQEAESKPEWQVTFLTRSTDPNCCMKDLVNFPIDFLFLDHDKDAYLSDLQHLEAAQCIRAGTAVAADNVVVFGLDAYRSHVAQHPCVTTTRLVEHALEYAEDEAEQYPDGMGASLTFCCKANYCNIFSHATWLPSCRTFRLYQGPILAMYRSSLHHPSEQNL